MANKNDEQREEEVEGVAPAAPTATGDETPEELARQRDEYMQRWQRATADFKNLRRRTHDDIEVAVRRTVLPLLESLLLVLDHLDLALTTRVESDDAKNLFQGVKLTRDQFLQALKQQEVEPIPEGGSFDPDVHEAVSTAERDDLEPGSVIETVRRGYAWRGLVLRHAHVVVSREKAAEASSAADHPSED